MPRRSIHQRRLAAVAAAGLAAAAGIVSPARAQVAALGKGHNILVNNGLQIWGLDTGASAFNHSNLANANFTGVVWSWGVSSKLTGAQNQFVPSGSKWGKWTDPNGNPALALD